MARSITTGSGNILPSGAAELLRRRFSQAAGICFFAASGALFLALFSYFPSDPSLNNATQGEVQNLLGIQGAHAADILLQGFGLAGCLPALLLAAWGFKLFRLGRVTLPWGRLILLAAAMILLALGMSAMATPRSWPLMTGLGGVVGSVLYERIGGLAQAIHLTLPSWAAPSMAAALGTAAMIPALGLSWREWSEGAKLSKRGAEFMGRVWKWCAEKLINQPAILEWAEPVLDDPGGDIGTGTAGIPDRSRRHGLVASRSAKPKPRRKANKSRQATLDLSSEGEYKPPPLELLEACPESSAALDVNHDALQETSRILESVLDDFGVRGEILKVRPGPVVTLYELEPAPGTKTSRVIGLSDDIARSMSAVSVRVAVVPGRNVIGIELPNVGREMVYLRELLGPDNLESNSGKLNLALATASRVKIHSSGGIVGLSSKVAVRRCARNPL
ncbi:MAG: DNA translocase FtsK 4TM domain-containing protein, partial [Rhodospirillales bacterium]